MAVVLAALGLLSAAAFWAWRINIGLQAGRELGSEARGLYRRTLWSRRRGSADRLRDLDDPREAAVLLMLAIARTEGGPTPQQAQLIRSEMTGTFGMDTTEAEALYAHAAWMGAEMHDVSGRMRRIAQPIFEACSAGEAKDVERMLAQVAAAESEATPVQLHIIESYARLRRETLS